MKFLICFVVFATITVIGIHGSSEDEEMLKGLAQDCKEKEGATDADIDTMVDKKLPETKAGKCMMACLQEQFGVVENGKFNSKGFMELAGMKMTKESALEKMQKVADECANIQHEDRCEMGYAIAKCIADKAKEHGVEKEME